MSGFCRGFFVGVLAAFTVIMLSCVAQPPRGAGAPAVISVVSDPSAGEPAQHGMRELVHALEATGARIERAASLNQATGGTVIIAGLSGRGVLANASIKAEIHLAPDAESLQIKRIESGGKQILLLAGADDRGLMYAELDVADRIGWAKEASRPLSEVRETTESPASPQRAVTIYTMQRAYFESRFYDQHYWEKYLDLMAKDRLNDLFLIFGYENGGFLAPCYPYFFDVDGYPGIRMTGLTQAEQTKNRESLTRLIKMAHDRGIMLTIGIWDHIYRGGGQGGQANGVPGSDVALRQPTPGWVWGVNQDNLMPYTKAALATFLQVFPDIDGIQFRMHDESGLKVGEQAAFWKEVFASIHQTRPNLRIDIRAKGLPDSTIQDALDAGINVRVSTKFWMEQMGLPYNPTHINVQDQTNRRHSYGDMLHYPAEYPIAWGLWNGGTARVLLWGDPDYARRFVDSTHIFPGKGDGGFEIDEPLCTKMNGQGMDVKPFDLLKPDARYYEYEFERYWHLFEVYGRLGYNPATPSDVWDHKFIEHFGEAAGPWVEKGLHRASEVLPKIVAACYPYSAFPMTRGWAEKQPLGTLAKYATAQGSDIAQFAGFDEEAQNLLESKETAKVRPEQTSRWFDALANDVRDDCAAARKATGANPSKEFASTMTDLEMLADLAEYHARRIPAAIAYDLYKRTHDPAALAAAIAAEKEAIAAWKTLAAAGGNYADNLMMGNPSAAVDLAGHWRDEIPGLERDLSDLEAESQKPQTGAAPTTAALAGMNKALAGVAFPTVEHTAITSASINTPLTLTAHVESAPGIKWVRLCYRAVDQYLDFNTLTMEPTGSPDEYRAVIPAAEITGRYDLMYYIEAMDNAGNGRIYPDLEVQTPYVVVRLTGRPTGLSPAPIKPQ